MTSVQNPDSYYGYDSSGSYLVNNTGDGIELLRYHGTGGNATEDRIFLLSIDEAKTLLGYEPSIRYDSENNFSYNVYYKMQTYATNYAYAQGLDHICNWWLRSTGSDFGLASAVDSNGSVTDQYIGRTSNAIRPALWVNLES